jgi:predicted GNAT superfamily acetyltransferase
MENSNNIRVRNAKPSDHKNIISVIPDWWGGRDLSSSVPKLLLIHFSPTSFVATKNSELCGFLIGFFSQTYPNEGYIHFVGVHPNYRNIGLARKLYQNFYNACLNDSRNIIKSCTAPINRLSIDFHTQMGFSIEPGSSEIEGVPITTGYLSDKDQKVLFKKILKPR